MCTYKDIDIIQLPNGQTAEVVEYRKGEQLEREGDPADALPNSQRNLFRSTKIAYLQ